MHGRLTDINIPLSGSNDREDHAGAVLLLLVEGEAATSDHLIDLIATLPATIAFVVRREDAEAHLPILEYLVASCAVFSGAPIHGALIRAGHVYLLDKGVALGRHANRFVLDQAPERRPGSGATERSVADRLTNRQQEILAMVIAGEASKRIAASLKISQRTVENHRASIMRRLGVRTLAALVRMTVTS